MSKGGNVCVFVCKRVEEEDIEGRYLLLLYIKFM